MNIYDEKEPYDVQIPSYENAKLENLENHDKLFVDTPNDFGLEAYTQLLPPVMKHGRIFRLRKSANEFPKRGIFLRQLIGTAVVPLVSTSAEVMDTVKLLFGSDMYKRMVYNYIFPRKIEYKNPLIPGSKKIIKLSNAEEYIGIVKKGLPGLLQVPSYMIRNVKNAVFDNSVILNQTLPNREMCRRPNVLQTSHELILQSLARLCFTAVDDFLPLYKGFKTTLPPVTENYKNLIIPFKLTTTNIKLATQFINPEYKRIPVVYRRDPEMTSAIGMLKFVIGLLRDDPFEGSPIQHELARQIKLKDHVVFVIYNDTHAFYIDYSEFKAKNMKYDAMFRFIRTSLKTLIALNAKIISPLEVEDDNEADDSDGIAAEEKINKKILGGSEFNKSIVDDINSKKEFTSSFKGLDVSVNEIENAMDDSKTEQMIAKAKLRLDERISLGHVDLTEQNHQTPIAANPDTLRSSMAELKKIEKLSNAINNIADDDTEIDFGDEEYGEYEDDGNETGEGIEDSSDETGEELSDDDLEGKEFVDEQEAEKDEAYKQKILESVRQTIEGKLTEKQQKYLDSIRDKYKSIQFDENETLEQVLERADTVAIDIKNENLNIKDKSYNTSILTDFTKSYVNKSLAKDIVATVKSFSDENKSNQLIITGFEKKDVSDQFNEVERYKFELKDKYGKSHNITFKMPKIDEDGFMYINGNKKLLKKQWILKPITKTSPDDVYCMSNYNKVHIFRVGNNINKNTVGLTKFFLSVLEDPSKYSGKISVSRGNNTHINTEYDTTIEYDELAAKFHTIVLNSKNPANSTYLYFNQKEIRDEIAKLNLKFDSNGTKMPIGINWVKGVPNLIETDTVTSSTSFAERLISIVNEKFGEDTISTDLQNTLSTIKGDAKKMCSKIEVQSRTVPLIAFLSGMFSFTEVLNKGNFKTVFIPKGTKRDEISQENLDFMNGPKSNYVRFADGTFYYEMYPLDTALLFNGLKELKPETLNFADLDNTNTYIDYTYNQFKSRNLIRGWVAFRDMFIDPKTLECLKALHLPTDMIELFLYANSLLQNNSYKYSSDVESWRIRDYEMLNAFLYESISENYRKYMQTGKSRTGFSIPEDDVIVRMNKNFVIVNYDTTSPANELKERGAITYKGPKGINSDRAFTLDKRGQTYSTIGTVAISSPDNGNVGIVKQLTMNPKIINTLGFVESTSNQKDIDNLTSGSMLSIEEACIPYINHDNPQRIGFTSGQTKHVCPAISFDVPIVSTGIDQVLPYKVSNTFGYKAKADGKVIKLDEENKFLIIKYKDGTTTRVNYGEMYNKNSDFFLQNNIDVNVKEGQTVKAGQIVTYNKDFFKKCMGKLIFTQGSMARVAIHEGEVTEDDSSALSWRLANKLTTAVIKRKQIILGANANIVSCLKVGDHVLYGDPLIVYENAQDKDDDMALLELLGDADDSVLDKIARHKASANYTGVIKDIKLYWTCDPDNMGESARKFVKQYINRIKKDIASEEEATGVKSTKRYGIEVSKPSGPMKDRINGCVLPKEGGILIEFYIEHYVDKRPGDKVSCNSALKTVINKVMEEEECAYRINSKSKFNTIDFIQSCIGINNRMVTSIYLSGFLSKVLFERGKEIASEFLAEIGEN